MNSEHCVNFMHKDLFCRICYFRNCVKRTKSESRLLCESTQTSVDTVAKVSTKNVSLMTGENV